MGSYKKISNPKLKSRLRRKHAIRRRISGTADRPRLSVFRSNSHIFVQAIDDISGNVLAAAGDSGKSMTSDMAGKDKSERAKLVGQAIGAKLKSQSIESVVFDRNGFIYHGRVKALADGAREAGLAF